MTVQLDERWLALWVSDDARAISIRRDGAALRVEATGPGGELLGDLRARFEAPDPVRATRPDSQPSDRMGQVHADVGEGALAQSYTLHFAVRDRSPEARFKYREARLEDPPGELVIEPSTGASWIESQSSDPWTDPHYGRISWAEPLVPFALAAHRAEPHPRCKRPSRDWKLSSHEADPGPLAGREVGEETARGWCELRCVRCGSAGVTVVRASDDSGTGWRQLFAVLRCVRCGRFSTWHLDDCGAGGVADRALRTDGRGTVPELGYAPHEHSHAHTSSGLLRPPALHARPRLRALPRGMRWGSGSRAHG
jgi:hypothetical protein